MEINTQEDLKSKQFKIEKKIAELKILKNESNIKEEKIRKIFVKILFFFLFGFIFGGLVFKPLYLVSYIGAILTTPVFCSLYLYYQNKDVKCKKKIAKYENSLILHKKVIYLLRNTLTINLTKTINFKQKEDKNSIYTQKYFLNFYTFHLNPSQIQ